MAGHESKRKLTDPIISYAKTRFKELYPDNSYDYSKIIRNEIKQHFDVAICAETLRPFLNAKKDELSDSYTEMREY